MKKGTWISAICLLAFIILDCTAPLFGDDTIKLLMMYIVGPVLCIGYFVKHRKASLIAFSIYELIYSILNILFGLSVFAKPLLYFADTEFWDYLNGYFVSPDVVGLPIWLQPILLIFIIFVVFLIINRLRSKKAA